MKSKNGRNPRESVCFVCFVLLRWLLCECVECSDDLSDGLYQINAGDLSPTHSHTSHTCGTATGGMGGRSPPVVSPPVVSKRGVCGVVCKGI